MEGEADFTVEEVVENLGLAPLAEGVWGRRMDATQAADVATGVYRLLTPQAAHDWRATEAEELWIAYMGAPLEIEMASESGVRRETVNAGSGLWITVPPDSWIRTRAIGGWCLAGRIGGGLSDVA
ncbi:cupin domain-containing protein [Brevundimonas diminuta]|uniref:cupin domain-containing protein n=1 Tax=Brevundimonas diminuta TaxID=293 RepID=UPI003D08A082